MSVKRTERGAIFQQYPGESSKTVESGGMFPLASSPVFTYLESAKSRYTVFVPGTGRGTRIPAPVEGVALPRFYVVSADVIPVPVHLHERYTRCVISGNSTGDG